MIDGHFMHFCGFIIYECNVGDMYACVYVYVCACDFGRMAVNATFFIFPCLKFNARYFQRAGIFYVGIIKGGSIIQLVVIQLVVVTSKSKINT